MKKFILSAALLLAVLPAAALAAARPARAEEALYARVLEEGVYLYSSADETSGLFILPRSYFVRIESEEDEWYRVLYREGDPDIPPVRGYCKRSEITPVDFIPQTPYLFYQIDITYRAGSGDCVRLRATALHICVLPTVTAGTEYPCPITCGKRCR